MEHHLLDGAAWKGRLHSCNRNITIINGIARISQWVGGGGGLGEEPQPLEANGV